MSAIIDETRRTELDEVSNDGKGNGQIRSYAIQVATWLASYYPGWNWVVDWKDDGCLVVKLAEAMDFGQYGFVIKPEWTTMYQLRKKACWAGGEFLERLNMPRGAQPEDYIEKLKELEGAEARFNRHKPKPLTPSQTILGA